jgi:uncharacterized protein
LRIFLILGIFWTAALFAYTLPASPNRVGPDGKRTGQWTEYLDLNWKPVKNQADASYYRVVTYQNGKLVGITRTYNKLGQIRFEGILASVDPTVFGDGKSSFYDDFGHKTSEGEFHRGAKNGAWQEWFEDGEYARGNYQDGIATGMWSFYDKAGVRIAFGELINGEREGLWKEVDPDGARREGNYRLGQYHGAWVFYYPNGQKESEGEYKNGKLEGKWTFWDDKGKLQGEIQFHDGEQVQ